MKNAGAYLPGCYLPAQRQAVGADWNSNQHCAPAHIPLLCRAVSNVDEVGHDVTVFTGSLLCLLTEKKAVLPTDYTLDRVVKVLGFRGASTFRCLETKRATTKGICSMRKPVA